MHALGDGLACESKSEAQGGSIVEQFNDAETTRKLLQDQKARAILWRCLRGCVGRGNQARIAKVRLQYKSNHPAEPGTVRIARKGQIGRFERLTALRSSVDDAASGDR